MGEKLTLAGAQSHTADTMPWAVAGPVPGEYTGPPLSPDHGVPPRVSPTVPHEAKVHPVRTTVPQLSGDRAPTEHTGVPPGT